MPINDERSLEPFFCAIFESPSISASSFLKKLGVGLTCPLRLRALRARVGGFGMPLSPGECSFLLGVTTPRILIACFPMLSSLRTLSRRNRINSCASCCSFPANDGTSLHTLRNKSCGGNASYPPSTIVRIVRRISAPTSNPSALSMFARRTRVIAGGRIENLRLALVPLPLVPLASSSTPPRSSRFRFDFNKSSKRIISSSAANDRDATPHSLTATPFLADRSAAASSPRRYSRNVLACRSACDASRGDARVVSHAST